MNHRPELSDSVSDDEIGTWAGAVVRFTRRRFQAKREFLLVLLLMVFAFFNACTWSLHVPEGQAPDEQGHMSLVTYIASHGRIPIFGETEGFGVDILEINSGSDPLVYPYSSYAAQPPLPYLLAAPLVAQPTNSVWAEYHQARIVQAVLAAVLVIALFWGMLAMFPGRFQLALTGAAFGALWPETTYMSAYFNADLLALVASTLVIGAVFRGVREEWSISACIKLGLCGGIAVLAKLNAWIILLFALVIVVATLRGGVRAVLGRISVGLGAFAVVAGPWLVFAYHRYGTDILARQRYLELLGPLNASPLDAKSSGWSYWYLLTSGQWLERMARSFVIGIPSHYTIASEYMFGLVVALVGLFGLVRLCVTGVRSGAIRRSGSMAARAHVVALAIPITLLLLISLNAYQNDIYFLSQGRYIFPGLLPLFGYFLYGVATAVPLRARGHVLMSIILLSGILNVWMLGGAVRASYGLSLRSYGTNWQSGVFIAWGLAGIVLAVATTRYWIQRSWIDGDRSTGPN